MSAIPVTPEQRHALACAADRPRSAAEARVLARLADESGMPGSAAAWREVAADGVATRAVRQAPRHERKLMPVVPQSGNAKSALQAVLIVASVLLAVALIAGACSVSAVAPTAPAVTPAVAPRPEVPAVAPAEPRTHAVARVIDGDTFEIEGGQRVRLLGIDACEMSTPGGKIAKLMAQGWLEGQRVTLVTDGARDRDRYGRILARAEVDGADVGSTLVPDVTVEVYRGRNDASTGYLAELRAADGAPRDCAGPPPTSVAEPTEESTPVYVEDDDDRDRESRFCRKRWWC